MSAEALEIDRQQLHLRRDALALDVTDDGALEAGLASVAARHGRIDILHNHAGAQVGGDLGQVDVAGFDRSWSLNVRAHFMAACFVMPLMRAAGRGVILNTSSSSGVLYDREMIAYTTMALRILAEPHPPELQFTRTTIKLGTRRSGSAKELAPSRVQRPKVREDDQAAARRLSRRRGDT